MKELQLNQKYGKRGGCVALVDDEDYEWLNNTYWHVAKNKGKYVDYAMGSAKDGDKFVTKRMHREIMKKYGLLKDGDQIDHINGNGLDNRKENLRACTNGQNQANSKKMIAQKAHSIYKGVSWNNGCKKWSSHICKDKKLISLGYYEEQVIAAKAYDRAAIILHKEFAFLNFPKEIYEKENKELAELFQDLLRYLEKTKDDYAKLCLLPRVVAAIDIFDGYKKL